MSAVTQNYVEDLEARLAKARQDRDAYQRIAQGLLEGEDGGVSPADLRHSRDQWKEQARQSGEDAHALLSLLCEIRTAAGDPEGKLMQPELVAHIKDLNSGARHEQFWKEENDRARQQCDRLADRIGELQQERDEFQAEALNKALEKLVPRMVAKADKQIVRDTIRSIKTPGRRHAEEPTP